MMWGKNLLLGTLLALGLSACSSFFEGGVVWGGPTVLVSRENFSLTTETDQNNNTFYNYRYTIVLYALPGSGTGTVILLDAAGNQVEAPFLIPQACPPSNRDPCGPYSREVAKRSSVPLTPVLAEKYRMVAANGQSKVVDLPAPVELY
uniref:Lipoprotein n=1 Tax=Thermus tengchongensis TaxID=1214928 RepID=A0A7V4A2D5_9DEIN